jgi:signal transduction histidine kinase
MHEAALDPAPLLVRARTLAEAHEMLKVGEEGNPAFDIALVDPDLPDSQGLETLEKLIESSDGTPVTILSGDQDRMIAVAMVQKGAQDFLPKHTLNGELLSRSILYGVERERALSELGRVNAKLRLKSKALKTAQMHLIQTEKLDSLGRLAAGVAHEVKNPLATLQMGVDFFNRKRADLSASAGTMIDQMQSAIERAETIIKGMVNYSRDQTLTLHLKNINTLVRGALRLVEHEAVRAKVNIELDLPQFVPSIRCDQGKIEQVFINILSNAIQAMEENPENLKTLKVSTFWDQIQEIERDEGLREFERLRPRDHVVVVEVLDQGGGIPEDKLSRIFEPFYTTKPTGRGTGLGLSVSKNIIDLHRGYIQFRNVDNPKGVRARIFFKAQQIPQDQMPPGETLTRPINPGIISQQHDEETSTDH